MNEMMDKLAQLDKKAAEDMAVEQFTNTYNKINEKDLDISKLELVLRNTFAAGTWWKEAVMNQEAKSRKSYADGLKDMFDAAEDLYGDVENWSDFYDELLSKKKDLESGED